MRAFHFKGRKRFYEDWREAFCCADDCANTCNAQIKGFNLSLLLLSDWMQMSADT